MDNDALPTDPFTTEPGHELAPDDSLDLIPDPDLKPPPIHGLDRSHKRVRTGIWKSLLMIVGIAALGLLGITLGSCSFAQIERMRQLERTPEVPVASVVTGEVNLRGRLAPDQQTLRAPRTSATSLYYRYTVEREERDSEGRTSWKTIERQRNVVDFILHDDSGAILVRATDPRISFGVPISYRLIEGDRRYTEYRLHAGDEIFLFGYAERTPRGYQVGFTEPGAYEPIISTGSEADERFYWARLSGFLVVLSVAALLFAVLLLLLLFRVHHSALYLSAAFIVMVSALSYQGHQMILSDLDTADQSAHRIIEEGTLVISEILQQAQIPWDEDLTSLGSFDQARYAPLSPAQRQRLIGVRARIALSVNRTNQNLSQFPEKFIGANIGLDPLPPVPLPQEELTAIRALESRQQPTRFNATYALVGLLIGLFGTLFGTYAGIKRIATKRTIENVPTSPISGVTYGLTEIKGQALPLREGHQLLGPVSKRHCLFYRHLVEQYRSSGKNSRWVTLSDTTEAIPFVCRDQTGLIVVDPKGAELSACRTRQSRTGNMRFTEWIIAPGEEIYILGPTAIHPATHKDLIIQSNGDPTPFLITNFTERELMQHKASSGFTHLNLGIVATIMSGMALSGMVFSLGPALYLATTLLTCAYLFAILAFLYYNDLVFLRERVRRGRANIEVTLRKRFDLVQNLSEIVKGYLGHERALQDEIARARNLSTASGVLPPQEALASRNNLRQRLLATLESYPDLKSDSLIQQLMETLTQVEDELAMMRQGYNDAVERYNTRIGHFPEIFIALAFRFREIPFFHR